MKLLELYKTQKQLRGHINYDGNDRAKCLFMAFWVELGECANEWKGFKFWSKKRWNPNTKETCGKCNGLGGFNTNPLLEEYIDGFHFLLDLGLEFGHKPHELWGYIPSTESLKWTALEQFDSVIHGFMRFKTLPKEFILYEQLMQLYLGLGQLLGFSENQIREAYLAKNAINHERQEANY